MSTLRWKNSKPFLIGSVNRFEPNDKLTHQASITSTRAGFDPYLALERGLMRVPGGLIILGVLYAMYGGIATPSDVLVAMDAGLSECKLFPATVVGGVGALKAYGGPFGKIQFCPTGSVNEKNYQDFLALPNVMCVGGSWVSPNAMIQAQDGVGITSLCKSAIAPL